MIQIHNQSLEMKEAWARIEAANEITENIKTTGTGNSLKSLLSSLILSFLEITPNDYAWFHYTASQTAYEDANFDACIQYCYR